MKPISCLVLSAAFVQAFPAFADDSTATDTPLKLVIPRLEAVHNNLSPETGSSVYTVDQQALGNLPEGGFTPLNEVLLQTPGVAQDSYGQTHFRGDHADLQYRLNGIILPEGITGFGQTLDTRFASQVNVLTGALPAQYGYRTAGITDITTNRGDFANGGRSSIMAGDNDTFEGNQEVFGSKGPFSYYLTGTYNQNDRGLEPPTPFSRALHDDTTQDKEFGYFSYLLSSEARLSFIAGNATNRFQIPNNPGQPQAFNLSGTPVFPSSSLNENQFEHNTYGIAALQGTAGDKTDYQLALFTRDSTVLFKPDPAGDLIYNGIASRDYRTSFTSGVQGDGSTRLNDAHTLRSGLTFSVERAASDTNSSVFSTATDCTMVSCTPFSIIDNHSKYATLAGVYLQDEWKAIDKLTVNYGARFDDYNAYVHQDQLSPRLGAVYELTPETKLHAGYARYFTPPPTELVAPVTISRFANTTGAPPTSLSTPVKPERDNYFDAGINQKVGSHLTLGADAYYKQAHNLLDEGQFGQALIFSPFNYEKGKVKGIEFTGDYANGPFAAYSNVAVANAEGKGVTSGQFNFAQDRLDYIATHFVHLDHDQRLTGSAGGSYLFREVKYSTDVLYGSGLRDGFANTGHLPAYTQVNAVVEHSFDLGPAGAVEGKFSVINLFDHAYKIRDGTGIGVFAPQFGPRRTFYVSVSKPF